jgi:hypothetical protein
MLRTGAVVVVVGRAKRRNGLATVEGGQAVT